MLLCEQLISNQYIKFKLLHACLTDLQVLELGNGISKRISLLNTLLPLHKHYEKKKKNQKSKARYAFYFLTVLYRGINVIKAAGSFRQTSLARILKHFFSEHESSGTL